MKKKQKSFIIKEICMHKILGYPPRKYWELSPCVVTKNGEPVMEDYTCSCPEGKKHTIVREIPEDNEWWEKEGYLCPYCDKERQLKHERAYYRKCSCGSRWYL